MMITRTKSLLRSADARDGLFMAGATVLAGGFDYLVLVVAGNMRGWHWVNALWFRLVHLLAIGYVVAQAWLGQICPLTTLESWLRVQAGLPAYSKSFVEEWVQRVLFYQAPFWVFTLAYTLFGLMVIASWWYFPPRLNKRETRLQSRS